MPQYADKGLSGARVLLAQWPLQANIVSAPHVLKIGDLSKLQREAERTEKLISPVDPQVGHIRLFEDHVNGLGLLRQAFIGSPNGEVVSLKDWIREEKNPGTVIEKIEALYGERMRQWHCRDDCNPPLEERTLKTAFDGRIDRQKHLEQAFEAVGRKALEESFTALGFANLSHIETTVHRLNDECEKLAIGLTHGDLHAQNVLVSQEGLQLIDFAWAGYSWKAVDFLMLECSLKLLVVPAECRVEDLMYLESILETSSAAEEHFPELKDRPYARYLRIFASAVSAVRKQALVWKAVSDFDQYRRGLIILMSCLGTYPGLNRNLLAHSLAYHVSKLR